MFNLEKIIMGRTSNHPLCFFWAVSLQGKWPHVEWRFGSIGSYPTVTQLISVELLGRSAFWETRTVKPQ